MMKMDCWIIRGNGFHFGRHGLGQEETAVSMTSDSLFAALIASLARQAGAEAVEQFCAPFLNGKPPFVLTSSFPLAGAVRFFPAPLRITGKPAEGVRSKDLKKVKYVSQALFLRLLAGENLSELYSSLPGMMGKKILYLPEEKSNLPPAIHSETYPIWAVEQRPRVALGRSVQNSNIYFTGRVAFAADCGLWFGIHWLTNDSSLRQQVSQLLAALADAGLGAERSSGFGACTIQPAGEVELPAPGAAPWVALSRYLPAADELDAVRSNSAAYALQRVSGWLDSPVKPGQRRRPVNLLAEGSVIGPLSKPVFGKMVDVRPRYEQDPDPLEHAVYRCGYAVAAGLQPGG